MLKKNLIAVTGYYYRKYDTAVSWYFIRG